MEERELRHMIGRVKAGILSRREFVQTMVALGLDGPLGGPDAGIGRSRPGAEQGVLQAYQAGRRARAQALWWQGATLLNPHFAVGTKDQDGSRIFYGAAGLVDPDGTLTPTLAAEIPSVQNGGVSKDGKSVTWRLKKGVAWHDGKPFTADDCLFTWEFAADPATASVSIGTYKDVKVEKVDSHTIRVTFQKPTPFWADPFCGVRGMVIPKHLFEAFKGSKSREAPNNLKPVGTGPYRFVDFKPATSSAGS